HAGTSNAERTKLGSTWFHHTALGLASTSTNGVDTGFIREPAGTLNSMTTGGKSYYYLTDATGNILGLADNTGKRTHTYAYGPTGLPRTTPTESVPQPYRYAGAYADPTGLYKMGHRYYDPTLGRFTQPDPSGQEKNSYLYAAGDPINNTDPTGLYSIDDFKSDVGFVGSTATIGGVIGGGVGSVVPVVGTGVGTVVGGVAGISFGVGFLVGEALGS
ncbi:RHS repeat-associated core domain-containing protein, partial [Streptomyces parvulus]|uniref:RHS repeat-associated core domain-containing protein n=1 Tax=Streptomyces parvulus TaxID=146923 RepID=UPI0033E6F0B9